MLGRHVGAGRPDRRPRLEHRHRRHPRVVPRARRPLRQRVARGVGPVRRAWARARRRSARCTRGTWSCATGSRAGATTTGPTAVLDHGANPGLVSHFTKAALADIADACLADGPSASARRIEAARADGAWNRLAQALGVKTIHISERDTQISNEPKREDEFVNTWSVEGFYEEGVAPAELGWGTHERELPRLACTHDRGPRNQICLAHPGCRTWVRSWVPCGDIVGMVIRHGEAFSISRAPDRGGGRRGRLPADRALRVLPGRRGDRQPARAAHARRRPAAGAADHERRHRRRPRRARRAADGAPAARRGGTGRCSTSTRRGGSRRTRTRRRCRWRPRSSAPCSGCSRTRGAACASPTSCRTRRSSTHARPYLGPIASQRSDWTPLLRWSDPFVGFARPRPPDEDVWQFSTFLVHGPD